MLKTIFLVFVGFKAIQITAWIGQIITSKDAIKRLEELTFWGKIHFIFLTPIIWPVGPFGPGINPFSSIVGRFTSREEEEAFAKKWEHLFKNG